MAPSVFAPLFAPWQSERLFGGWRQRAAATRDHRSRSPPICRTALKHLSDWGLGTSSSAHLWSHMDVLVQDGFDKPAIKRLHQVASQQTSASNAHSGLMRLVEETLGFGRMAHRTEGGHVTHVSHPSALFGWLHKHNRSQFELTFGADKEKLVGFGTGLFSSRKGRELRRAHPLLRGKSPRSLESTIPIVLHEDAGPYSKRHSAIVVSWSALLGIGTELECKVVHHTLVKNTGQCWVGEPAWDVLFSDLELLADGRGLHSEGPVARDDDGTIWNCVLLFGKGDFEQLVHWGHRSYNGKSFICSSCDCNRTDMPWTDLGSSALWRRTANVGEAVFRTRVEGNHPITRSIYFNRFFSATI